MSRKKLLNLGYVIILALGLLGYGWHTFFNQQVRVFLEGFQDELRWETMEVDAFSGTVELYGIEALNTPIPLQVRSGFVEGLHDGQPDHISLYDLQATLPQAPQNPVTVKALGITPSAHSNDRYSFTIKNLNFPATLAETYFNLPGFAEYSPLQALQITGDGQITLAPQPDLVAGNFKIKSVADISLKRQLNLVEVRLKNAGVGNIIKNQTPGLTSFIIKQFAQFISRTASPTAIENITRTFEEFLKPHGHLTLLIRHDKDLNLEGVIRSAVANQTIEIHP